VPSQPGDTAEAVRLRNGHEHAVSTVRNRILTLIEAAWNGSANMRDEDADRLVRQITPLVESGQLAIARLTSVYLAQQAVLLRGVPYSPAGVDRSAIAGVRGVPVADVYRRPVVTVYTALSKGVSFEDAKAAGLARLLTMAATDMQLAKTTQAAKSLKHSGAQLYRRVTTGKENCPICDLAAKHYYKTGSLAPIHDHCDCGVEEMPPNGSRAGVFEDLSDVKGTAFRPAPAATSAVRAEQVTASGEIRTADGTTRAPEFTDLAVSEHGEIGPVLHWAQHSFTTVKDLPASARPKERPAPAAEAATKAPKAAKPKTAAQQQAITVLRRKVAYQAKKLEGIRRWEVARQAAKDRGGLVQIMPDGYPEGYSAADHKPTAEFRKLEANLATLRAQLARKTV
jgi:hypothetical protein